MTDKDEERIIAYVDGELAPLEALRFERAMDGDPALAEAVGRHRRLRETVAGHFSGVADEPLPDRLRRLLDRDEKVIPFPPRPRMMMGRAGGYAALAATLVAGLVLGQLVPRSTAPVGERDGRLVAAGGLARALDSQLASTQIAAAPYRIGVSFRTQDGRYCRSFEGAAGAGLGCRGAEGWTLERFVAGMPARSGAYAQAGSPLSDVLAAAQDMMAGNPLDATAERQARDAGWQAAR
ncbi:anti-sigma factor family protein [Rhizorhabdus dicambivorans]|uniref:Anti-sigma factor n=1 Tax=Rhizorhabdus dicambivorans TaxID=1850238 RepID=A0A2A4FVM0_9SPHN|nr:anti-sigma factor [Rhizorhabdus dicambivorans]ATE66892.1 anti-sigma factor [Rhizorhabdus dicambivorans]PCE42239.1 anti-sigma factor [Rhizorhabdus dicambivorans]